MIENLPLFLTAALVLNISPGPDHVYILGRTLAQGQRAGFISSLGVCTGALVHVLAAAFGFAAIVQSSPVAYALLQYGGAAYLAWLGIQAFRTPALHLDAPAPTPMSLGALFKQGVLVDVLNPKVALFFLAFLPQFVPHNAPSRTTTFIALGAVVILIAIIWEALLVLFADKILGHFLRHSRAATFLNQAMGVIFVLLAVRLVLGKR